MSRFALTCVVVAFVSSPSLAQDAIPAETVATLKRATVFIRVQGADWKGTGSGFVVSTEKDVLLIATNHHVIASPDGDRTRLSPTALAESLKKPTITVVFDPGTKAEQSIEAKAVAADPDADLAVLRVAGVKDPPAPIPYADPPKPSETMPVYSFGFPFGQALSTTKGAPAVTVGKASVSSLRLDDDGNLARVQIDGNLNPGNSGGPVVDVKGRLVGVAVSTIRNGQGIGFAVPAEVFARLMKGRVGNVHLAAGRDGKPIVRAEVSVIDPVGAVKGVTLYYILVPPGGTKPSRTEPLWKHPDAKKLVLKLDGWAAVGEIALAELQGDVVVQAVPESGPGAEAASKVRAFNLTPPRDAAGGKPPAGWKEYSPSDRAFTIWVPAAGGRFSDRERTETFGGQPMKFRVISVDSSGPTYSVDVMYLPPAVARQVKQADFEDVVTESICKQLGAGAKIVDEVEVKVGQYSCKEFLIQSGRKFARVRAFVSPSHLVAMQVTGTRAEVDAADAITFLSVFRLGGSTDTTTAKLPTPAVPNPAPPVVPAVPGKLPSLDANLVIPGRGPRIQGGLRDAEFEDKAPAGGLLVGIEVGVGSWANQPVIKAVRPVYRTDDKDTVGEWHGPTGDKWVKETVRAVAKPSYAVGAISVKNGLGLNGLTVTFMKVKGDKLDPTDKYDSEFIGGTGGGQPVKVGGDGTPAVGLIGKARGDTASGLGLLYTDMDAVVEKALAGKPRPGAPTPNATTTGRGPRIQGGGNDPEFEDTDESGGLLVGVEVGVGRFVNNPVVKSVRPIYRAGDKDTPGEWHGPTGKDVVTETVKAVAKPGYAVGAITVKNGLGMDGLTVTFMKIKDGKLDPSDAYDSDYIGGKGGGQPVKLGGDGTPVIGLIGKARADTLSGLGLMYEGGKK